MQRPGRLFRDPNFPQVIEEANQAERILRYQDLYKRYSHLDLSSPSDRPMAIGGLQDRILRALRTPGGFGVFDEGTKKKGLRHSLLWYRSHETPRLERIHFNSYRSAVSAVLSWSWMAYMGSIDYISPAFGGVQWEDLRSPWSGGGNGISSGDARTELQGANSALEAATRMFDLYKGYDHGLPN